MQHSKEAKKINDYCARPFKLCPKQQEEESKRVHKEVTEGKLEKVEADEILTALCLPTNVK